MLYFEYDACQYERGRRDENTRFWVREAIRIADLDSHSLVLDLGCGTGTYAQGLKEKTLGVVCGLDPAVEMLRVGQLKDSDSLIHWLCGVAESIPFREEIFDCVFSSQVWHHIQDKHRAAKECYRVLKHSFLLVIRTISHDQWREKTICSFFPEILPSQIKVYPSMMEFKEYLSQAGFRSTEILKW